MFLESALGIFGEKFWEKNAQIDMCWSSRFTNSEEAAAGFTGSEAAKAAPFWIEDEFKRLGGVWSAKADWNEGVCVAGNLITGQNPQSSEGTAKECIKFVGA